MRWSGSLPKWAFPVLHDKGVYDYPAYNGAYSRSGAAIQKYLALGIPPSSWCWTSIGTLWWGATTRCTRP